MIAASRPNTILTFTTVAFLLSVLVVACPSVLVSAQPEHSANLERAKRIAETQHEIIMLLIKKKEYEKAAAEADKIFTMKWPDSQESLLLSELLFLSDQFLRNGQPAHGLKLIQKNSKSFRQAKSQIRILQEKGYLYKCMGQHDKALDCFREAREMEDKN
jgi:tetratricopeptide (TPR) repeat protein